MRKALPLSIVILFLSILSFQSQAQSCGGACAGFKTFTQGGWGAVPHGGNPGVYLHANFATAFPTGLTIGSGTKTVKFTTAQAITDNMPVGGGAQVLPTGNVIDPAAGYLNTELDGQIIAAMLSVGFDASDAGFSISTGVLGNLVFNFGAFSGKSVQFVITEANKAIGSVGSSYSLSDINTALTSFNENYDNGTAGVGNGNLNCPSTPPSVEDISGTASICKTATSNFTNATAAGVWSSDNTSIATVNASGLVTGVAVGNTNITYTVTTVCGTTVKSFAISITDCSGVESGGNGGLESKSLGDAVGNRIFNKAVNSLQGPVDYSKTSSVNQSNNKTVGIGTAISLSDILPKQISGVNYKPFTTTPTDIPSITNAKDVLSIDYTFNNQAKAVAFGTKTFGEVYDHTKAVCDRLKGAELVNVQNVVVSGINLVRFDLKNPKGQMEYTFSFAIGAKTGRSNYTIQSNWLNKDYLADEVMFNVQLWAEQPSLIENMAADILARLNSSMPVKELLGNHTMPKTFITSGKRESENINLQITNTTAGTNGYFEVIEKANEQSGNLVTKQIPFTIATNGTASVKVPAGDTYESTINMYLNGVLQDQVFLSDGNWAANVNNANSMIKNFTVSNDASRVVDNKDDFLLFRNVKVEAITPDYISVYKLLKGGGAAQDLTGYKTLSFSAAATGATMNIILVKAGVTNWTDQYSLSIPLSTDKKDYKLSLDDFTAGNSKDKINPNDISTIIFALVTSTGKLTTINAEIGNVSFSKTDFAYLQTLNSTEINAFPNPSKGRFNATFKSAASQKLVLTVRDASTGIPVYTQNVQAQIGSNTVPVTIQNQGNISGYILSIEGQGVRYTPKKMLIEK